VDVGGVQYPELVRVRDEAGRQPGDAAGIVAREWIAGEWFAREWFAREWFPGE